ncbi:MAG: hypothetical protein NTV34_05585 [Proteobacteria bacterium]|nr:hypothetical protein [Pseudomonadota bacterium]
MKNILVVLTFSGLISSSFAQEEISEFGKYDFDWSIEAEDFLLRCDDSYYSGIDLVVPGKPYKDFILKLTYDATQGHKSAVSCSVLSRREVNGKTIFRIQADTDCEVTLKRKSDDKTAKFGFGEC